VPTTTYIRVGPLILSAIALGLILAACETTAAYLKVSSQCGTSIIVLAEKGEPAPTGLGLERSRERGEAIAAGETWRTDLWHGERGSWDILVFGESDAYRRSHFEVRESDSVVRVSVEGDLCPK